MVAAEEEKREKSPERRGVWAMMAEADSGRPSMELLEVEDWNSEAREVSKLVCRREAEKKDDGRESEERVDAMMEDRGRRGPTPSFVKSLLR